MSIFKKIGKVVKKGAHAAGDAAKDAGGAVVDTAKDAAKGAGDVIDHAADSATDAASDAADAASDVIQGHDPTHNFNELLNDLRNATVGTVIEGANVFAGVGEEVFQDEIDIDKVLENQLLVVYHNAKSEVTSVLNATGEMFSWATDEVNIDLPADARMILDNAGKLISITENYIEQLMSDTIKDLYDDLRQKLEQAGEQVVGKIHDAEASAVKSVTDQAEHVLGSVEDKFDHAKSAILKVESQIEELAESIPKELKDSALTILEQIGQALAAESLKLIYTAANEYRKLYAHMKKTGNEEAIDAVNQLPVTLQIGIVMMFFQNFPQRVDKVCELLLRYHHHPPPPTRAAIIEMVEALEADFIMIDASVNGSLVIADVSLLKFDLQAPFVDKSIIRYALNKILKLLGMRAGDMSRLKADGLDFDLPPLDDTDYSLSDTTPNDELTDDSNPDNTDSTYDPNSDLDIDPDDLPDDLPTLSDEEIQEILDEDDDSDGNES